METEYLPEITYSDNLESVIGYQWEGKCLHVICLEGEGHFMYDDRPVNFHAGEILVLSYPERVTYYLHSENIRIELIAASLEYIHNLLPANHYGIGGGIRLYQNPTIQVSPDKAQRFLDDIHRLRDRSKETEHHFLAHLIGSLLQTMVYDLFDIHASISEDETVSDHTGVLVQSLLNMLESGSARTHRDVAYYAGMLNVSPRYLSDTVRRITGQTTIQLITIHTIPIIVEYLRNPRLSLTQIADEMEFTSMNYFSRYVLKHLGMTPTQYRASLQPQ